MAGVRVDTRWVVVVAPRFFANGHDSLSGARSQVGGVAIALHLQMGQGFLDLAQIFRRQLHGRGTDVLVETVCRFSRSSTACLSRMFVMGKMRFPGLGGALIGAGTVA